MAELAWTSFDKLAKIFRMSVPKTGGKIHPTQKPIRLYEWLLMNYAKEGDKILDTHLGSGSIALACHNLNFDLTACELDTEYYNAAMKRLKQHATTTNNVLKVIKLRPYQNDIIQSLRNSFKRNRRTILCAPTGAGKTIMFTYLISEHLKRGGNVLVLTHRSELLKQAGSSFEKFGLTPEYITSGSKPDLQARLHVGMVETIDRRKETYTDFIASKSLVVIDEAHLNIFTKLLPLINP